LITKVKIFLSGTLLLLCLSLVRGQELVFSKPHLGFNIGANFAVGSHFQRFGLNFHLFYVNKFFQSNSEVRAYFSFKNLGPQVIYEEVVLSQGVVLGYGSKVRFFNPFLNSVSNQTGHSNSVAYSYNAYFNSPRRVKTTQQTGIISLQFNSISFIAENDLLAKPLLDRYRTGAFLLQYQYEDKFQTGLNCTMWTGFMGKVVRDNSHCPANCYIDTTGGTHTQYSHGLLSAQFKYNIGLSQVVQANIGIDAQQVRHAVQNKVIHDLIFLPKAWPKRINCHIPMLDENNEQYLFKPGQKIKKPHFYWNVFSNANLFY
jgi:hypothetical protein